MVEIPKEVNKSNWEMMRLNSRFGFKLRAIKNTLSSAVGNSMKFVRSQITMPDCQIVH